MASMRGRRVLDMVTRRTKANGSRLGSSAPERVKAAPIDSESSMRLLGWMPTTSLPDRSFLVTATGMG